VTPSLRSTAATSFRLRRVGFKSRPQVRCSIPAFRHPRHRCSVRPRGPNRVPGQAGWAHPRSGAFGFNGFEYDRFVRLGLPIVGVMGQRRGVGEHQNLPQDDVSGTGRRRRSRAPSISRCRLRAGCYAELVTDPEELAPALKRARASGLPSLVNVHIAELNDPAMTQHGFMPRMSSSYSQ
jgi:hypothetical protein